MAPDTPRHPCNACSRRAHRRDKVKQRLWITARVTTGAVTVANIGMAIALLLLGRPDEASGWASVASATLTAGKALNRGERRE